MAQAEGFTYLEEQSKPYSREKRPLKEMVGYRARAARGETSLSVDDLEKGRIFKTVEGIREETAFTLVDGIIEIFVNTECGPQDAQLITIVASNEADAITILENNLGNVRRHGREIYVTVGRGSTSTLAKIKAMGEGQRPLLSAPPEAPKYWKYVPQSPTPASAASAATGRPDIPGGDKYWQDRTLAPTAPVPAAVAQDPVPEPEPGLEPIPAPKNYLSGKRAETLGYAAGADGKREVTPCAHDSREANAVLIEIGQMKDKLKVREALLSFRPTFLGTNGLLVEGDPAQILKVLEGIEKLDYEFTFAITKKAMSAPKPKPKPVERPRRSRRMRDARRDRHGLNPDFGTAAARPVQRPEPTQRPPEQSIERIPQRLIDALVEAGYEVVTQVPDATHVLIAWPTSRLRDSLIGEVRRAHYNHDQITTATAAAEGDVRLPASLDTGLVITDPWKNPGAILQSLKWSIVGDLTRGTQSLMLKRQPSLKDRLAAFRRDLGHETTFAMGGSVCRTHVLHVFETQEARDQALADASANSITDDDFDHFLTGEDIMEHPDAHLMAVERAGRWSDTSIHGSAAREDLDRYWNDAPIDRVIVSGLVHRGLQQCTNPTLSTHALLFTEDTWGRDGIIQSLIGEGISRDQSFLDPRTILVPLGSDKARVIQIMRRHHFQFADSAFAMFQPIAGQTNDSGQAHESADSHPSPELLTKIRTLLDLSSDQVVRVVACEGSSIPAEPDDPTVLIVHFSNEDDAQVAMDLYCDENSHLTADREDLDHRYTDDGLGYIRCGTDVVIRAIDGSKIRVFTAEHLLSLDGIRGRSNDGTSASVAYVDRLEQAAAAPEDLSPEQALAQIKEYLIQYLQLRPDARLDISPAGYQLRSLLNRAAVLVTFPSAEAALAALRPIQKGGAYNMANKVASNGQCFFKLVGDTIVVHSLEDAAVRIGSTELEESLFVRDPEWSLGPAIQSNLSGVSLKTVNVLAR